jgi:aminopeptidase N
VDDTDAIGFALETQTRPVYSKAFFGFRAPGGAESIIVHELAHQWAGDSVALAPGSTSG